MIKTGQTIASTDFATTVVAGEALTANDAVYILASDGKAYKCDADDTSKINFVGFVNETVSSGANVNIIHSGQMSGFSSLTIGSTYYLSGTAGAITSTPPTNSVLVGFATSATTIKFNSLPNVRINKFTSSGTWTKLAGLKYVEVELVGAGGGGGGLGTNATGDSGGGGGGGYSRKVIQANTLGSTETVTVGTGGGGGNGTSAGSAGGTSSFGSHLSATGGGGGNHASLGGGGAGGVGSSGDVNSTGNGGGGVSSGSSPYAVTGVGGGSYFGGGSYANGTNGGNGQNGQDYGGGGGGATSTNSSHGAYNGGTGGNGVVIVKEFY
jgi:hypothetical protein